MQLMTTSYFSELLPILAERSRFAATSWYRFSDEPLRRYVDEMFSRSFGEPGAFLADPAFEAVFGWKASDNTMDSLAGSLLSEKLVNAMDNPPDELANDYRFPRDRRPYRHQVDCWKILAGEKPCSLIAASGTGSGKTECFMVPILDRLVRELERTKKQLNGVRAIFLYPLNALINSQRERLRAWTHAFGSDIRFCLYNGNTPERLRHNHQRDCQSEIADRTTLRASPPPILVTNATMLEYMLVRTIDAPILKKSQGMLEWIVLDEAHNYIGSQAAELALLIRRVLYSFGVSPEKVRFVATSATIGDPDGDAGRQLRNFLADIAGVSEDSVYLVAGEREVPPLPDNSRLADIPLAEIAEIDKEISKDEPATQRFAALVRSRTAREIRERFVKSRRMALKLSEVTKIIGGKVGDSYSQQQSLRWLDLLSGTKDSSGTPFLPLRAHLFHQTISGLWACADRNCCVRSGPLEDKNWPFGRVYFDPRKHCECGSPAYELVCCIGCGAAHLLAAISNDGEITHISVPVMIDDFELNFEPVDGAEPDADEIAEAPNHNANYNQRLLITNRPGPDVEKVSVEKTSRKVCDSDENAIQIFGIESSPFDLACPLCSERSTLNRDVFQTCRIGAPYLLGDILPTLLEFAPDGQNPQNAIYRGRKLLTFNDSRQGTARLAANLQQSAELTRTRGLIYHLVLSAGKARIVDAEKLEDEIRNLEIVCQQNANKWLVNHVAEKREELRRLQLPQPVTFDFLARELANQGRDFTAMLARYREFSPLAFGDDLGHMTLAKTLILREFARRPSRMQNLETIGMIATAYPGLDAINGVPEEVAEITGFSVGEWRDFLKICLDYFVRRQGALEIDATVRHWIGFRLPRKYLVSGREEQLANNQVRWPRLRTRQTNKIAKLLALCLNLNPEDNAHRDHINTILDAAWENLIKVGVLQPGADGYQLPLSHLAFILMREGWICPVTRRVLDVTLRGITPHVPKTPRRESVKCEKIEIPVYDLPFSGETDPLKQIERGRAWLRNERLIEYLRAKGVWTSANDRVIELAPYYVTAEHSAQIDSQKLSRYESDFRNGRINILSCSTTMEMGIDIGGVSLVGMNNVPPHPANYLQRAGRSGRRGEGRSVAATLCRSNPHDQAAFANSLWAFENSISPPRVALDSPTIVERHVNAFLLSHYLKKRLAGAGKEPVIFTCGAFFLNENDSDAKQTMADDFVKWCENRRNQIGSKTLEALASIVRRSVFEDTPPLELAARTAAQMSGIIEQWNIEWNGLLVTEKEIRDKAINPDEPVLRAIEYRKRRQRDEFLLRELTARGFLPAYGFPRNVVAFDNMTVSEFKRRRQNAGTETGREDNLYKRRELPNRDIGVALREYAPGSQVVIDGLVYRSAGITLNWKIPADRDQVREVQNLKIAWRCIDCGASGSMRWANDLRCRQCNAELDRKHLLNYLEPAGFAVDFYEEPGNDYTSQHFVPVQPPWIGISGEWQPLGNHDLGRFRVSTEGNIFVYSAGESGLGYAVCLECGRCAPVSAPDALPGVFTEPHRKLRRSQSEAAFCPGSENEWKITRVVLGAEVRTDICEIQLRGYNGEWVNDSTAARTIGVALRDAFAASLGIQAPEFGSFAHPSRTEDGSPCRSIFIFDRFAAGYSSRAGIYLNALIPKAIQRLHCPANCDSACPRCILDFDQRFETDRLDRKRALELFQAV